jgi:phospholipid/cholesterol/gamma-HCH transport system substrate-binding protein
MKDTLETRLGIFVALALIAGVLVLELGGGMDHFRHGINIRALFNTAQELKVGDRVKMAGVEIGRVEEIGLSNGRVQVTMKLRANHRVNTECIASIKFTGLMGQNFVALDFGQPGAPLATDGTVLKSTEQADFAALMSKLDNVASGVEKLTQGFAGDEIQNLASSITGFFKDNRDNLRVSFQNISNITTQVAAGQGTAGKLIMDDGLYTSTMTTVSNLNQSLSQTSDEIRATVADARKIVNEINAGQGTAGKLVKDGKLYDETTASMTNLKEILQKVNRGEGSVGTLINDDSLIKNAKLTLQKLDKATEGLEDQGPLSILGIVANGLF